MNTMRLALLCVIGLAPVACSTSGPTAEEATEAQRPIEYQPELIAGGIEVDAGVIQYTSGERNHYGHPHVSYDGRWLAYASDRMGMNRHIYVQEKDGHSARQLTSGTSNNVFPQISLDSSEVAFASDRDGKYRIYSVRINGSSGLEELSSPLYESLSPTWAPDGNRIAYMSRKNINSPWMITVRDRISGTTQFLTHGSYPDWSPDGSRLVFQRASAQRPGYTSIFTCKPDGSEITQIYSSDSHGAITPAWAGDRWILFATVNKSRDSLHRNNDAFFNADDIWMVNADGTQARRLTAHRLADWDPCFDHRKGEVVYISNRDGVQNIYGIQINIANTWKGSGNSALFGGGR